MPSRRSPRPALLLALALFLAPAAGFAQDHLSSWNPGPAKRAIESFVGEVTRPGPAFVEPKARVAVFDNDGTLWTEQPIYTELVFSLQRAAQMAKADPELAKRPAFQAVLSGDPKRLAALSMPELLEIVTATHSGMTTEAFSSQADAWLRAARHPRFGTLYTRSIYQPMLELMDYLRANGFAVYIVSGGDADFMRAYAQAAYGVPPQNVIGSSSVTSFGQQNGAWGLVRTDKLQIDDKATKPSNIALHIGRRPIFAAGNSDGDLQMLQYATSSPGKRLGLIVRHDDAAREYAYDRQSKIGTLDKALDAAGPAGWTVVSMRSDWKQVFPAPAPR